MRNRKMNEIEQAFYDAWLKTSDECVFELEPQKPVGIYVPDFVYGDCVIEIDGHEFHKTKEQREEDYKRERYYIKKGYYVVRFMATEVFLDALKCVQEATEIAEMVEGRSIQMWQRGFNSGDVRHE